MGHVIQQVSGLNHQIYLIEYHDSKSLLTFSVPTASNEIFTEPMKIEGGWCKTERIQFQEAWFTKWKNEIAA